MLKKFFAFLFDGAIGTAMDLRLKGRGFESWIDTIA